MSKPPPSAFDFLMSGARAAASKKKPPPSSSSSPKKRKSPPPSPSPSPSPSPLSAPAQNPNNNLKTLETVETVEPPPNKIRNTSSSSKGIISELKELIPQLKKKPPSFDPSSVVCWEKDKPVPFLFLCLAFDMINEESGRIVKTDIVCNLLRTVIYTTPEDLVPVVYLSANRIAPAHQGLELGIGDASIIKALAEACGRTEQQIRTQYKVNCCSSFKIIVVSILFWKLIILFVLLLTGKR
jgi:DNA ligase-1